MPRLKKFTNSMRVEVKEHDDPAMVGMLGTVVRLRQADNGAWVRMNIRLDSDDFPFPEGDSRSHHTLLYPDQCEKTDVVHAGLDLGNAASSTRFWTCRKCGTAENVRADETKCPGCGAAILATI